MPTEQEWQEIAAQLQAPFAANEVKQKKGRGSKQLSYIDARAVAARLDAVVGPGNWAFNWEPMVIQRPERGVVYDKDGNRQPAPEPEVDAVCVAKGILTIHGVSKADIGYAGPIEPNKASISNALRRCAALWGIGRYLYNQEQQPAQQQNRATAQNGAQRPVAANLHAGGNAAQGANRGTASSTPSGGVNLQRVPITQESSSDPALAAAWKEFAYIAPLAGYETERAQIEYLRGKYPNCTRKSLTAAELWTQSTLLRAGLGMAPHPASGAVDLEAVAS